MIINSIQKPKTLGFTLIEIIVSLALFTAVVTIAVGALLVLVATNEQLQGEQSVMTNLSFALDSMTREIRSGTKYFCVSAQNTSQGGPTYNIFNPNTNQDDVVGRVGPPGPNISETLDCPDGGTMGRRFQGVSFIEGGNSLTDTASRILYYFDQDDGTIYRRVGGGAAESIVSSNIYIHDTQFFVTGSSPQSEIPDLGSYNQPTVTIFIEASEDVSTPDSERYRLQTTVTQRELDI